MAETDNKREIPAGEKAQAAEWQKRLEQVERTLDRQGFFKTLKANRLYVSGRQHEDGRGGLVRANLIHATINGLLPHIYARNPEITVAPSEAASEKTYGWLKPFCKTLQAVLNRQISGAGLKRVAKGTIRSAMTTALGWVKVAYQQEFGEDPIIQGRIADAQDNIARVRRLAEDLEKGDAQLDELDAQKESLQQQLKALESEVEVKVSEGLVIDRLFTEDVRIDPDIRDIEQYQQAKWIAHRIWMTEDECKERFGRAPGGASRFNRENREKASIQDDSDEKLVAVWEVWDRMAQHVYTLAEGDSGYLREPYVPGPTGERFFPFFLLAFNPLDGQFMPLSVVELLKELQDEYNASRTQLAEHRRISVPHWLASTDAVGEEAVRKYTDAQLGEVVLVDTNGRPLSESFQVAQTPPINPQVYDTNQLREDWELISGMSDAARGNIGRAKTATEAEILQSGLTSRTGEAQDVIEDWIQEMAQYTAEVLLQILTPAQAQRIAGPDAVWPKMPKEDLFDMVQVEIRAGTSGKPNKLREREQWLQFLPELKNLITQVGALRAQGQTHTAEALINTAKETLRRFDERLEVEEFLPQPEAVPSPMPGAEAPAGGEPGPEAPPEPGAPAVPPMPGGAGGLGSGLPI